MPRGGARVTSGPPPDPNALRRDRASDKAGWTTLPAAGRAGKPPAWPLTEQTPREIRLWDDLWSRPQAVMWEKLGQEYEVAMSGPARRCECRGQTCSSPPWGPFSHHPEPAYPPKRNRPSPPLQGSGGVMQCYRHCSRLPGFWCAVGCPPTSPTVLLGLSHGSPLGVGPRPRRTCPRTTRGGTRVPRDAGAAAFWGPPGGGGSKRGGCSQHPSRPAAGGPQRPAVRGRRCRGPVCGGYGPGVSGRTATSVLGVDIAAPTI
jgi:hypothetical protein